MRSPQLLDVAAPDLDDVPAIGAMLEDRGDVMAAEAVHDRAPVARRIIVARVDVACRKALREFVAQLARHAALAPARLLERASELAPIGDAARTLGAGGRHRDDDEDEREHDNGAHEGGLAERRDPDRNRVVNGTRHAAREHHQTARIACDHGRRLPTVRPLPTPVRRAPWLAVLRAHCDCAGYRGSEPITLKNTRVGECS
jgi:hypothetical protein